MEDYLEEMVCRGAVDALLYCSDCLDEMLAQARLMRRDFLVVCDVEGCIIQISPNSEKTLGLTPDEAIGHNIWDFIPIIEPSDIRMRWIDDFHEIISVRFSPQVHVIE